MDIDKRTISLIIEYIKKLELDLSGLIVLTEVGSKNYLYTPIIAALANAKQVNVWVNDTEYGHAEDIKAHCNRIASGCGVADKITIVTNCRDPEHIKTADVVTNSGALRPINSEFIDKMKSGCVIPLMYEAWEFRDSDVDLSACRKKGVKISGTWENHPLIRVFDSFGMLSIKLALEAGLEVFNNKVVIWSADHFGEISKQAFEAAGASHVTLTHDRSVALKEIEDSDFIYFCNYNEARELVGESDEAIFKASELKDRNENLCLLHMYGNLNFLKLKDGGFQVYPEKDGKANIMTETLAYLGPKPVISLQVAGFKVAQLMHFPDEKYTKLVQKIN